MAFKDPTHLAHYEHLDHVMPTQSMPVARPPLDDPWLEGDHRRGWSPCGKYDLEMPVVDPAVDIVIAVNDSIRHSWPNLSAELAPRYGIRSADDAVLRSRFERLTNHWLAETRFSSSVVEICTNDYYLKIIGLGAQAVPLIFERVEQGESHWSWALTTLTGANPAKDTDSQEQANSAWLTWRVAQSGV